MRRVSLLFIEAMFHGAINGNIHGGEALLVLDENDVIAGYTLLKRIYTEDGKLAEVKLLQGETDPQR
jgi:hypothetical protein